MALEGAEGEEGDRMKRRKPGERGTCSVLFRSSLERFFPVYRLEEEAFAVGEDP